MPTTQATLDGWIQEDVVPCPWCQPDLPDSRRRWVELVVDWIDALIEHQIRMEVERDASGGGEEVNSEAETEVEAGGSMNDASGGEGVSSEAETEVEEGGGEDPTVAKDIPTQACPTTNGYHPRNTPKILLATDTASQAPPSQKAGRENDGAGNAAAFEDKGFYNGPGE
ncbi:uncharacterized protein BKA78DRAFT_357858 [Phyllosticta capitalensis]|uniref:uncharacterized protein n=1 Tax=Phyllosticta capitalensis TaxID=121624 RepID=UPI00312EC6CA